MNRDYRHYSTDDFIADEFFQQWVQNPTERHNTFWSEFLLDNPFKHAEVTQAVNFLNNMRFQTTFPGEQEIEYSLQKQLQLIEAIADVKETAPRRKLAPRVFAWTATAIFTAFLLFAGWYFWQPGIVTIEIITAPGEIKNLLLPDSSKVIMNGSSTLRYTSNIHKAPSRDVWLTGEAFFEVKKPAGKNRQFVLHNGDLLVQVLGTSFNVRQNGAATNVTLNNGSLRIGLKNDPGSILTLQPGDFVQYSDKDKHILRKHVHAKLYSAWIHGLIQVDSLPIASLAALFQDVYGFDFQAAYLSPDSCISGSLNMKNSETLLKSIASLVHAEVIKTDSVVWLKPKKTVADR
jgi:ferric-dicitrate binding protein FerR (iron transport regulator)